MNETDDTLKVFKNRTYLALGDSYTIGEAVEAAERWPVQLIDSARKVGYPVDNPKIIATTGWTTGELKKGIENEGIEGNTYDFVSLLIGVNNQYRGQDIEIYRQEFEELLLQSIEFAGGSSERVFVVSIPDYGVTPFGKANAEKIAEELDEYNQIAEDFCSQYKVRYFYITDISRQAKSNPELIASDNLHPSGEMYQLWVERIYPWFAQKLNDL